MMQTPLDHPPLFSKRLIDKRVPNEAIPQAHATSLQHWAATIRNGSIRKFGEVQIRPDFISAAQKLLDRVLFVAFADDRGLCTSLLRERGANGFLVGTCFWKTFRRTERNLHLLDSGRFRN